MIKIICSDENTDEKIIYRLMDIEAKEYEPCWRGEFSSIRERFIKYPEMFYLVYDGEELVGYFCYFPISQKLYEDIAVKFQFHDDDILPDDIVPIKEASHLYLLSVVILKQYQDTGVADEIMKMFENFISQKRQEGVYIKDVIASTVTNAGEKFVKRYGYELMYEQRQLEGFKIYKKEF